MSQFAVAATNLMALSVADLAFLVLLASLFVHGAARHSNLFHIYAAYAAVLTNVALMASVWLTVLLAIERYVAICTLYVSFTPAPAPRGAVRHRIWQRVTPCDAACAGCGVKERLRYSHSTRDRSSRRRSVGVSLQTWPSVVRSWRLACARCARQ